MRRGNSKYSQNIDRKTKRKLSGDTGGKRRRRKKEILLKRCGVRLDSVGSGR
jgi:hypothetical protein